jgi:L-threonylcarbamoyladenylate synthase
MTTSLPGAAQCASDTSSAHDIERAARRLLQGGLVAFPTETVYGLGADAENPQAIARIYAAKGRPSNHPVIVHVAPDADIAYWSHRVPAAARQLIDAFWPGPLTLILPRAPHIPSAVAGGQDTLGIRCPSHPVAQALLTRFARMKPGGQGGVAAPSANKFGQVSPTTAAHVRAEFPELDESHLLVLEGGPSEVGIESTILDVSRLDQGVGPVLLRPGHIQAHDIARVLGLTPQAPDAAAPRVSGSLKAHYAPRTPLFLVPGHQLPNAIDQIMASHSRAGVLALSPDFCRHRPGLTVQMCDSDPKAYARGLYAMLRGLDALHLGAILVEQPPLSPAWQAVNDRLGRAAAAFDTTQP